MAAHPVEFTLLTPRGPAGVAVVALSGPGLDDLLSQWLRDRHGGTVPLPAPGTAALRWLWIDGEVVDQILVVPRSDRITELHLHGSAATLSRLERASGGFKVQRLTDAGKLVRAALGEGQLRLGLEQLALDQQGVGAGASLDAALRLPLQACRMHCAHLLRRSRLAVAVAEPIRLVLCGRQNAGKSTLFNRLLGEERALVGPTAGLTRDPVRAVTLLDGYPYELVDTAGEGETGSALDQRAVEVSRQERHGAMRIVVVDGTVGIGPLERSLGHGRSLRVWTKSDLPPANHPAQQADRRDGEPSVAQLDPACSAHLRLSIGRVLRQMRGLPEAGAVGGAAALTSAALKELKMRLAARLARS